MYSGGDAAADLRKAETERQARVEQGMLNINKTFEQFNEPFYAAREKAYVDYATPQLGEQYRQTRDNLGYALARAGLLNSTAAVDKQASLDREMSAKKRDVANTGLELSNQTRADVESQRSNLVSQLNASADPYQATNMALASAKSLARPGAMPPLGNLFNDWSTIYLANMQNRVYNGNGNTGEAYPMWTAPSAGSSRIIR